jgi:hypothetical protein
MTPREENRAYPYVWFWRSALGDRKGMPCRVLARGRMNSILVEFEDGYRVVTARYAVRRRQLATAQLSLPADAGDR